MPFERLRIAAITGGRPYHATLARLPPGMHGSTLHGHADFYEFMGVLRGRGRHRLQSTVQGLSSGDLVVIRPGDRHAFSASQPEGLQFVNVAFPATAWRRFLVLAGSSALAGWDDAPLPVRQRFRGAERLRLERAFQRVLAGSTDGPSALDLVAFWLALAELVHDEETQGGEPQRPPWLTQACAAMRDEENLRGGLPRFVELASVSQAYLSRTVRACYGKTPTEMVTELRVEHAAALLATTSLSITQIAGRCGFSSPSYFTRCFHTARGVSPRAYRDAGRRAILP
jgi:AraC-like DNA-binding protein/mannose-6-phosphate isomerase-like protein (cupin superfamily)